MWEGLAHCEQCQPLKDQQAKRSKPVSSCFFRVSVLVLSLQVSALDFLDDELKHLRQIHPLINNLVLAILITVIEKPDFYMGYVTLLCQFTGKSVNFMESAYISSESLRILLHKREK